MKRRDMLRLLALSGISNLCGCSSLPFQQISSVSIKSEDQGSQDIGEVQTIPAEKKRTPIELKNEMIKDMKAKSVYFEQDFPDDIHFAGRKLHLVNGLVKKFRAVQRHIGHGNFNLMGMDEFFRIAKTASGSSEVNAEEKLFLEELFFFDAKKYGFQGEKVIRQFTDSIRSDSILKIPYTGHFLRKGVPVEIYNRITKDIGDSIILTSGFRALAKQYHLYLEKAVETNGNMSKASRSLAPPGYSFHGQGDFDIGRRGFGLKNFSDEFASTDEFKKLLDLGYVEVRYTESNLLGVRFEPWHIKVHLES